jgi:hypothetical protein
VNVRTSQAAHAISLAVALAAGAVLPAQVLAKQRDAVTRPAPDAGAAQPMVDAAARLAEARALLKRPDERTARQQVAQALARGPADPEAAAILTCMQEGVPSTDAPAWFGPLNLMAQDPERLRNPLVLGALSSFRTRESARVLLRALSVVDGPSRATVFAALTRLSGRDDLGDDAAAWSRWFAESELQSESQWRSSLLDALGIRADRLNVARESAVTRLADGYARLHLATPAEQRSALLASMINDPLAAVCFQGMDLVSRELAATNRLDGTVGDAAVAALSRPEPELRARASLLVNQLVPESGPEAVRRALSRETDPRAAAALLQTATRWPSREVGDAALLWMTATGEARSAAFDAAWSMLRAGALSPEQQERALTILRDLRSSDRPPSSCHMLAWLGDDSDRASMVPLLQSVDAGLRLASAESLAPYPEFAAPILDAVGRDGALLLAGVRVVVLHDQTARGFEAINRISAGSEGRRNALVTVASVLPAEDLLIAGRSLAGDPLQEAVLAQFAMPVRLASERVDSQRRDALAQGLLLLARRRIESDLPAEALSALDQMPGLGATVDAGELARLRIVALLMLGRIDAAAEVEAAATANADAWLEGLDRCAGKAHAAALAAQISAKMSAGFSDAQRQRFADVSGRIAPAK